MLIEREFIKTGENIYKIGKSKQDNLKRFNQYPKQSKLLLQIVCDDCDELEKRLLKIFKEKYIHCRDIGNEYFQGDCEDMIQTIYLTRMAATIPTSIPITEPAAKTVSHSKSDTEIVIEWLAFLIANDELKNNTVRNLYKLFCQFINDRQYNEISETKFSLILKNKDNKIPFNIGFKRKSNGLMRMFFSLSLKNDIRKIN